MLDFFLNSRVNRQIKVKVLLKTCSAATFIPDIFKERETLLFAEKSEHGALHQAKLSASVLVNVYLLQNTALN